MMTVEHTADAAQRIESAVASATELLAALACGRDVARKQVRAQLAQLRAVMSSDVKTVQEHKRVERLIRALKAVK